MIRYLVGLDLGQSADYTAVAVAKVRAEKASEPPTLDVVHLERYPTGTAYTTVVVKVSEIMASPSLAPEGSDPPALIVDATGVGRPVVDMFDRKAVGARMHPLTITGGSTWRRDGRSYFVPKKDLAGAIQTQLQTGRLKVVPELHYADTLKAEMLNFRVKITAAANETFEAWRENEHDDLVLAVAMIAWYAEAQRNRQGVVLPEGWTEGGPDPSGFMPAGPRIVLN